MVQSEGMLQTLVRYQECPALRNKNGKENAIKKNQKNNNSVNIIITLTYTFVASISSFTTQKSAHEENLEAPVFRVGRAFD